MDELMKIEAHDSEVLCLAFSPNETGKRAIFFNDYHTATLAALCTKLLKTPLSAEIDLEKINVKNIYLSISPFLICFGPDSQKRFSCSQD